MTDIAEPAAARIRPLSALDPRTKFALLLVASLIIFVWNSLALQALALAAVVALMLGAGIRPAAVGRLTAMMAPAFVIILVIQGLWSPFGVTPVFVLPDRLPLLGGATVFTVEGLLFGLVVCCRLLIPLFAFQYVHMTTEPHEIVLGLTRIGVPYRVAYLFSATMRFLPLLLEEVGAIRDAQRLRGIDVDAMSLRRKLLALGRMLVPLITGSLARAQRIDLALQARAFTGARERTALHPGRASMTVTDRAVTTVLFAGLAAAILGRIVFGYGGTVW